MASKGMLPFLIFRHFGHWCDHIGLLMKKNPVDVAMLNGISSFFQKAFTGKTPVSVKSVLAVAITRASTCGCQKANKLDVNNIEGIVGKHLVYVYDNGWKYEIYVKNCDVMDYRIHSGIVADRWVKDQQVNINRIGPKSYKICWTEPTGTDVSLVVNLEDMLFHGTIFFPRWVADNPEKTICFQNEHIEEMEAHRDKGPTYPKKVIGEYANIIYVNDVGRNNDCLISKPASMLPKNYPDNLRK